MKDFKMKELEHKGIDIDTKDYQFLKLSKSELEEKMKIDQEKFEKMTELEQEWELFRRDELRIKLEKWIEIKRKLDKGKTSNDEVNYKN